MQFEWHKEKDELNFKKHKVNFLEASAVFEDPLGIFKEDFIHSINEFRSH